MDCTVVIMRMFLISDDFPSGGGFGARVFARDRQGWIALSRIAIGVAPPEKFCLHYYRKTLR